MTVFQNPEVGADGHKGKQEGLLLLTAQHAVCETWNVYPSYWGLVPLGPNFTGTR